MMYKAFAALTLIAAPILTFAVQGLAPRQPVQPVASPVAPVSAKPAAAAPLPVVSSAQPAPEPVAFGQPIPDAGKPFLAPGNGLPGAAPAPSPDIDDGSVQVMRDSDK